MNVYEELERQVLPQLEAYQADLTKHDRAIIEANPGMPFLHWTRNTGTTICLLPPADHSYYPPQGVEVKYLFGMADREHILTEKVVTPDYYLRPCNNPERYTCRHYNGEKLRVIDSQKAVGIVREYARMVRNQWKVAERMLQEAS